MALNFKDIIDDIEYDVQERIEQLNELLEAVQDLGECMETGPGDDDIDGEVESVEVDCDTVTNLIHDLMYTGPSVQRDWANTVDKALEYYREEYE